MKRGGESLDDPPIDRPTSIHRPIAAVLSTADPVSLTQRMLRQGVRELATLDAGLGAIVDRYGPPLMWERPRGFTTLVRIILEQQVSLASAASLFARIERELGGITPSIIRAAGREGLRARGLTRQKAAYVAGLAERVADGSLPLATLHRLPDAEVAEALIRVPGIGPWTASIYLLMALRRPDVWPPGDLALHKAMARLPGFESTPSSEQAAEWALRWRPWRAVAARILWHGYLSDRAK